MKHIRSVLAGLLALSSVTCFAKDVVYGTDVVREGLWALKNHLEMPAPRPRGIAALIGYAAWRQLYDAEVTVNVAPDLNAGATAELRFMDAAERAVRRRMSLGELLRRAFPDVSFTPDDPAALVTVLRNFKNFEDVREQTRAWLSDVIIADPCETAMISNPPAPPKR